MTAEDSQDSIAAGALLEHSSWVRELAQQLVRDAADADDVVQEAYLAALHRVRGGEPAPRGWLARVVYNQAALRARSSRRRGARERQAARDEALPSPADLAARAEAIRRLDEAVRGLRDPYRSILELRYYHGLSPAQIAAKRGAQPSTVRSQLARAVSQLRELLDERHDGDRRSWACALVPLAVEADSPVLGAGLTTLVVVSLFVVPLVALCAWWLSAHGADDLSRALAVAGETADARDTLGRLASAPNMGEPELRMPAAAIEAVAPRLSESPTEAASPNRIDGSTARGWITLVVENERGERVEGADVLLDGLEADGRGYWRPGFAPRGRTNTSIEGGTVDFEGPELKPDTRLPTDPQRRRTDASGELAISYPVWVDADYVATRIRFQVSHPDYATSAWRPELAPRIRVVLVEGPSLTVSGWTGPERDAITDFQVSIAGGVGVASDQWRKDGLGRVTTTRLLPGRYRVRLRHESHEFGLLFSDVATVELSPSAPTELCLELKPATRFVGRLGPEVQRPVIDGRAWAMVVVWSDDRDINDGVHSLLGADVQADGSFVIDGLPEGDVQVLAFCNGWSSKLSTSALPRDGLDVTTTDPNDSAPTFSLLDPTQVFTLDMERTASAEFTLREPGGSPAAGIDVELALIPAWDSNQTHKWPDTGVHRIAVTDAGGAARIEDVPVGWHCLTVRDPRFDLPLEPRLGRSRWLRFSPGEVVRASYQLAVRQRR